MKIPKVIVQTFSSRDKMTPQMVKATESWKNKNPDWEYKLFDNNECIEFIGKHFDKDTLEAFNNLLPGAFKGDLFRYCYLYVKGGVYTDMDNICLVPLNDFLREDDTFVSVKDRVISGQNLIYNAFIAAEKNHPTLKKAIDLTVHNAVNSLYPNSGNIWIDILDVSGPKCLATALESCEGIKFRLLSVVDEGWDSPKGITHIKTNSGKVVVKVKYDGYKTDNNYWDLFRNKKVYKTQTPLISCLCPTKNDPSMVEKAVECFNNQTYPNKELILVSDEKNPHLEILETFVSDNIKLFKAPHGSVMGKLRNISLDNSNGEYIATWDDDDISFKDRLTEQYNSIVQSGKEVCYLTNALLKNNITNEIGLSKKGLCADCTMLAFKGSFPRYDDEATWPVIEDLPIRKYYSKNNQVTWLNKPHLYLYNIHKSNTCNYSAQKNWMDIII